MKYLLDTNALIGFLYKPDFLSVAAKNILENEDSLYVSIVSLWEIMVGTVLSFHFRQCNNTTFHCGHSATTFRFFIRFSAFVIVIRNNSEPPLFFRSGSLFCACLALAKAVAIPYNKLLLMHKQQGKKSHDR